MSNVQYVQVAPCIPLTFGGHESYTYHSTHPIFEGAVVRIPFGVRSVIGVVVQTGIRKPRYPTKPITKVTETTVTKNQMEFAKTLAHQAHGGLGYTLRLFVL